MATRLSDSYTLADSRELIGDEIERVYSWKSGEDLSALRGKPIRLRVVLKDADLYEKRDLQPTTDLRAVLKGLLADHLCADERRLEAAVFPDSGSVKPLQGLLA